MKINIADLPAALGKDLVAAQPRIMREVQLAMKMEIPRMFQEEIVKSQPRQPVSDSIYKNSIQVVDRPDGGAVAFNSAPYAGIIERGRRPGKGVSREGQASLARWVRLKGLTSDEREARGIAFAIARKMKKQGWPFAPNQPMRVLGRVYDRILPVIEAAVTRALKGV